MDTFYGIEKLAASAKFYLDPVMKVAKKTEQLRRLSRLQGIAGGKAAFPDSLTPSLRRGVRSFIKKEISSAQHAKLG